MNTIAWDPYAVRTALAALVLMCLMLAGPSLWGRDDGEPR